MALDEGKRKQIERIFQQFLQERARTIRRLKIKDLNINPFLIRLLAKEMNLIEKNLPIEKLNPVAMAEGNAKKPVYQMHKWWARRLGSVFRMITLSTFSPEDVNRLQQLRLFLTESQEKYGKS